MVYIFRRFGGYYWFHLQWTILRVDTRDAILSIHTYILIYTVVYPRKA